MATKLEDLVIRLKADSSDLERELRKSGANVSRFAKQSDDSFKSMTSSVKKFAAAIGLAFAANEIRKFASAALELGSSLNDTAARLGTTAEALQVYRLQAKEAGVDAGAVDSAHQSFAKTLGMVQVGLGRATKQLASLDPTLLAALKTAKSVDEAYRLVADSVRDAAAAGDEQRAAAIAAATGMSPLLGVLKEGSAQLDTFSERMRALGLILSNEAARSLDAFGEALDRVKATALVGFAEGLAGVDKGTQDLTTRLSDPATLKAISDYGHAFGVAANYVTDFLAEVIKADMYKTKIGQALWPLPTLAPASDSDPQSGTHPVSGNPWGSSGSGPWSVGPEQTGITPARVVPRTFGPSGGGGSSKGKSNAAPKLDYSITHFDYFAAEKLAMKTMVDDYDKSMEEMKKSSAAFAEEGIAHFNEIQSAAATFGSFAGNIFGTLARDGKLDFKSLAMSFAETIVEMETQAAASWLFTKAASGGGKGGGGSSGSWIGSLLGGIGSLFGFAEGGHFTRPTLAMVGDGQQSEWALPDSKLKALLSASGGKTVVNVNNYGSDQVTTKNRRGQGGTDIIDIMVGQSIRRQIGAGAMKDEFGRRHAPGVS